MPTSRFAIVIVALFSVGCASLSGSQEQYFVCSYDIVWDATLETMKGQSVATYDKDKGVIELETRQRWHSRGGVTQQALRWWPIEPSEDAANAVVNRLNAKLKERGCVPT